MLGRLTILPNKQPQEADKASHLQVILGLVQSLEMGEVCKSKTGHGKSQQKRANTTATAAAAAAAALHMHPCTTSSCSRRTSSWGVGADSILVSLLLLVPIDHAAKSRTVTPVLYHWKKEEVSKKTSTVISFHLFTVLPENQRYIKWPIGPTRI